MYLKHTQINGGLLAHDIFLIRSSVLNNMSSTILHNGINHRMSKSWYFIYALNTKLQIIFETSKSQEIDSILFRTAQWQYAELIRKDDKIAACFINTKNINFKSTLNIKNGNNFISGTDLSCCHLQIDTIKTIAGKKIHHINHYLFVLGHSVCL